MAIDRAVLLPGQELMQRMDHKYNGTKFDSTQREEMEEKIRREESGSQAENAEEGQDPEQDQSTEQKMHQDESEKDTAQTG